RREPLTDIAFRDAGTAGKVGNGDRLAVAHRLVQAELVSHHDQGAGDAGADVPDEASHQGIELLRIWLTHDHAPLVGAWPELSRTGSTPSRKLRCYTRASHPESAKTGYGGAAGRRRIIRRGAAA